MAVIGTLTKVKPRNNNRYIAGIQSADLDAAAEETTALEVQGFGTVKATYNLTAVGTNVVAILWVSLDGGTTYLSADSNTDTDNGVDYLTYSGYCTHAKVELDTITTGTPKLEDIAIVAYDRF